MNKFYRTKILFLFIFLLVNVNTYSQCYGEEIIDENIEIKVNGKVDFTIIGNSQNAQENNSFTEDNCDTFVPNLITSASLTIPDGDTIVAAHLYWSASGNAIETVQLNNQAITADKCWKISNTESTQFAAYADVTEFVVAQGDQEYTLSGLDNTIYYEQFRCSDKLSSLYGGWALVVVFENEAKYDNNTIYFYDGFEFFQNESRDISIYANVFENFEGSHIGLIAWEGDEDPFVGTNNIDSVTLNGEILPSNGYTTTDNIFNGTESFSNPVKTTYNVDIDNFDATDVTKANVNNGPTNFNFNLTTGRDVVLLSSIVFRIPNEAPDAIITTNRDIGLQCSNSFNIDYTYYNADYAQKELPAGTPIHFYLNSTEGELVGETITTTTLLPGQKDNGSVNITLPEGFTNDFSIIAYIDAPRVSNNEYGSILELEEQNNTAKTTGTNVIELVYPTAFTPNKDGVNDFFKGIIASECSALITSYKLEIYNRFGNLVASIDDNTIGWNGITNNHNAVPGLFTWKVEYSINNGEVQKQNGAVTLIR